MGAGRVRWVCGRGESEVGVWGRGEGGGCVGGG